MRMENDLGRDSVGKLVLRIAIPSMLGQFVNVLYSIVDRIFIGNLPAVGGAALAGVGICGPIVAMVGSAAFLVGAGGSPLMSIRMGEGKTGEARKILANCFLLLCVFAAAVTAILLPLKLPMLRLFGASEAILPYADTYLAIYLSGTVFALLSVGLNQFIICQGFARVGMLSVMLGAVLNIALDPIFLFVFSMGVGGAALATVLSQAASAVLALAFLFSKRPPIRISFGGYHLKVIVRVLTVGLTPFVIIAIDNMMIIAMNAVLQSYGGPTQGDFLVTCATVAQSFLLVVTMPLGGISTGTQAILGYNYGAMQLDRVKKAQKYIFALCVGYTTTLFLLAQVAGPLFVRMFTPDPVLADKAFWAVRVVTLGIIPLGVQYEIVDGFTGIGKVGASLPLSLFRKAVYFSAIFLLPAWFGAQAAFYAQPISDVLGPAVSIAVYAFAMPRILHNREQESHAHS